MRLEEILGLLEGVTQKSGYHMAKCPAHDDKKASLSVSRGEDGKILLNCHAGCTVENICEALGISVKDLFQEPPQATEAAQVVATYDYTDISGNLLAQKLRKSDKSFMWRRKDSSGSWVYNRKGLSLLPYNAANIAHSKGVYLVEGEKDVNTLKRLKKAAISLPDGAGSKWKDSYSEVLKGRHVAIIADNDEPGRKFAEMAAGKLLGEAASVRVLDLTKIWAQLPEHGDTTDIIMHLGDTEGMKAIAKLAKETEEWKRHEPQKNSPLISCFKTLDTFTEEEASWLVPGWIPEGQITLMAADGGIGKTTLWCNLIAALSVGQISILDTDEHIREPSKVAFLTTEDSVRKKLKKKLRLAGANEHNIITPDFLSDSEGALRNLKFGSSEIEEFIRYFKPALCVFDPVQGFVPPDINMGSRNAMRDCMSPLISLGEECKTTFLVVCHTNKRKGAYGRDRIADSADLWDISRSVLMAGYTDDNGVRYLSNEKNNYTQLQQTILFTIDNEGQAQREGTTWKRDREYMQDLTVANSAPKREECKEFILHALDEAEGSIPSKELESKAKAAGYSEKTIRNAKDDLKNSKEIKYTSIGNGRKGKTWYIEKTGTIILPSNYVTPFDDVSV